MKRIHFLAAEVFGYSYYNYDQHLGERPGMGNLRFEKYMPADVRVLERAERERWDDARLAKKLEIEVKDVPRYRKAFRHAVEVVDAPNAAESFRHGVRNAIVAAFGKRLASEAEVEALVGQICYRAADFGFLLDSEKKRLSDYTDSLRLGEADPGDKNQ